MRRCFTYPRMSYIVIFGIVLLSLSGQSLANVITIKSHSDDYRFGMNIGPDASGGLVQIGGGSDPDVHQSNFFFIFALPPLQWNETVEHANLTFEFSYANFTPNYNVDVWAVGIENSTTPILDFFNEDTGDVGNTKIDDNVITAASSYGAISTSPLGDIALADYIRTFYDVNPGYTGGDFLFLRLNHDARPGSANFVMVSTGESSTGYPVLTLDVAVPEPSTLSLIAFGFVGLTACRRRKRL